MLIVISPSKTLDFETPATTKKTTEPDFLSRSAQLIDDIRTLSPDGLTKLMRISPKLAELNHRRFMNWTPLFTADNGKQSLLAFKGDVYTGLDAQTFNARELAFAQKHLRILSGLYGLLRPLDLIQPYRLEMGLNFKNCRGKNLYEFWGDDITDAINRQLKKTQSKQLINLASNEYFKSIKTGDLGADIITPIFKDLKNGKYKIISFYAKKARGLMARYIIENGLSDVVAVKKFDVDGYHYTASESTAREWVFTRDKAPKK
tara:strand:+ start:368 stop:1150 length:783 start_codon:yes stop_codon:yes gene_type:complete